MAALPGRAFWGVLATVLATVVLFHLPSLRLAHVEGDEIVFTFLAERLGAEPLRYTLRGELAGPPARRFIADTWAHLYVPDAANPTHEAAVQYFAGLDRAEVLYRPVGATRQYAYDPTIYDTPMFFHPPLYAYTLTLFRHLLGTAGGPLLSILLHGATIAMVALLGRRCGSPETGLVAAALVAIDPVSWMCGSRLWIDGMAGAMTTAAVLAGTWAVGVGGMLPFGAAGLVLGLACWTKLSTLMVVPALVVLGLVAPRRPAAPQMAAWAAPVGALLLVWLVVTRLYYGAWLPTVQATPWILAQSHYLQIAVGRPWHFYLTGLLLVAPVYVYALPGLLTLRTARWVWVPAVWWGTTLAVLTVTSVAGQGGGFQLRYLAPGVPGLCLLTAAGITAGPWWRAVATVPLGVVTFMSGYLSGAGVSVADPVPAMVIQYLDQLGSSLSQVAPGLW